MLSTEIKATTLNDYVCKYGRKTFQTCGFVAYIDYTYAGSNHYVLVGRPVGSTTEMGCLGDSGSPVFKHVTGGVSALGTLVAAVITPCFDGNHNVFIYTPVDEINRAGFSILTTSYQQRYYQNAFFSDGTCTQYVRLFDDNGNPSGTQTSQSCQTSKAISGTVAVDTYTAWVIRNYWHEAMWQGVKGWYRDVPLNSNGTINWNNPPNWVSCCPDSTPPRSQDGFILGNHIYQVVFWTETNCLEYKRALDIYGFPLGSQISQSCRTSAPGSGTITSYTAIVVGGNLREAMWRGGTGYTRVVPLNSTYTDVNWAIAPGWTSCNCTASNPSTGQGGDILSHP